MDETYSWFSEWALLVPAWSIVTVLLTYFMYFSMAIRGAPGFAELSSFTG
jgi:phosphatidylinositol glycan class P protein